MHKRRVSAAGPQRRTGGSVKPRTIATLRRKPGTERDHDSTAERHQQNSGCGGDDHALPTVPPMQTPEGVQAVSQLLNSIDPTPSIVIAHHLGEDVRKKLEALLATEPHLELAAKNKLLQDEITRLRDALSARAEQNIIAARETERNLKALQAKEHAYFEVVHGFLLLLDAELNLAAINEAGKTILGCTEGDILGKSWVDTFVVKNYVPEVRALLNDQLAGKGTQPIEYPVLTATGEERVVSWKSVLDTSMQPHGLLCAGEDITMLRQLNIALQMSEERLHLVMESEREDEFFIMDPEGYIVTWISRPDEGKNFRAEEAIGKHFSSFYTPEDFQSGKPMRVLEVAEREGRFEEECWRLRKDGTRMRAYIVVMAIRDEEKNLLGFSNVTHFFREEMMRTNTLEIPAHLLVTR